jgi:cyclic beta-1,2-glucan synthetase
VDHQIRYGQKQGLPWGISESGYYAFDGNQNYQYRAFGVPGLGFKRDLGEDSVVAPYASLMALPFRPAAVAENLAHLARLGALGIYGLYEAVDFTASRLPLNRDHAVVREYMTHHQGMILLALDNYLAHLGDSVEPPMLRRFHADPLLQSVDLLLQERVPTDVPLEFPQPGDFSPTRRSLPPVISAPWNAPTSAPMPHAHYLSNGRYGVMVSSAGGGYSRWDDFDLTRWRADTTLDDWGSWLYAQDRDSGKLWSAGYQPTATAATTHDVRFYAHKVEFRRTDDDVSLTLEVAVSADDDVEIRRVTVRNHGERPRRLALTSYAEVVMAIAASDQRHPAFSKLFVESEYLPESGALVFRRRPRSKSDAPIYVAHFLSSEGGKPGLPSGYESDRARFLGRGGSVRAPEALLTARSSRGRSQLSGTAGSTLDPIMSLQYEIELEGGGTTQLAFFTAAAASRPELLAVVDRYRSWTTVEHAIGQSRARAELELRQTSLSSTELEVFQTLLSALLYPYAGLRAEPTILAANRRGQPGLWAYGISGDYPILLARIVEEEGLMMVRDLLRAHAYWRRRGLKIDLVILNAQQTGYNQELRDQLQRLLTLTDSDIWLNQRGGIFVLSANQLNESDNILLQAAARVIVDAGEHGLTAALAALRRQPASLPAFAPTTAAAEAETPLPPVERPEGLLFDNGIGGFSPDGKEYVIYLDGDRLPPAPWVNVVANPQFGFLVSESGGGFTWALNSGEHRLTPWSNDPVSDPPGEALYLRDEETAQVWSATPQPAGAGTPYVVRHGAGYTTFEHNRHGLRQRLRLFAPPDAAVKIVHLRLENATERPRRITATFYAEWVLGTARPTEEQHVIPSFDEGSQALLARNPWHPEFAERVAFAAPSRRLHGLTTDRSEFLGRHGSLRRPAALDRVGLSGAVQPGLDPCAAIQLHVDLPAGGSDEVWFLLGDAESQAEAVALASRYQDPLEMERAWQAANGFWNNLLGMAQVRTPEPAMDLLLNRWLLYQSLSCRLWGRSAFYQSSGAFGFRDQLQDVMGLMHAAPALAREHILNAAGRQFEAGDVLHWWHPPSGRGVRTRCSDDLLWLPYVTAHYVEATGDLSILDERVPFLRASPPLAPGEDDRYGEYPAATWAATLHDHCRRALERGTTAGVHGLPLIGSGDWNDGMNRVGAEGQGESVWLGWFLYATLTRYAGVCERRGDSTQAAGYVAQADALQRALEQHGWDGEWYLRAFYDDGAPLGSMQNDECQIDAIAQSWATLSGAGDGARVEQAMNAVLDRLARPEDRLLLLFTPPFDKTTRDPGYIKGYLPGTRENGGQYTHAAIWSAWACLELGWTETAESLFRMLNPIHHGDTRAAVERYKVEPYVVAADVYSVEPHRGRGGWTWYTGSAAWMHRLGMEGILGLRRAPEGLIIEPRIPPGWPGFEATYRYGAATYRIRVRNEAGRAGSCGSKMSVDGQAAAGTLLELRDDGMEHQVEVILSARSC